jgi:hypothetical protein
LVQVERLETPDQCELLLCAKDLAIETASISAVIVKLVAEYDAPGCDRRPLLHSAFMQLVFARFAAASDLRHRFIDHWVEQRHLRGQSPLLASAIINIALLNMDLLSPESKRYVCDWHVRHSKFKSDKIAAWAPYCLRLAGLPDKAREQASRVLSRREKDGSWGHEIKRTVGCAYALALSQSVEILELETTLSYIVLKFCQGIRGDLSVRTQTLRLLHQLQRISPDQLNWLRTRLEQSRRIFISYCRKDLEVVDRLAAGMKTLGLEIWIDRTGIATGEQWIDKLTAAISACDAALVFISRDFIESEYCLKEVLFAQRKSKPLLAVHLDASVLPDSLEFMLGDIQRLHINRNNCLDDSLTAITAGINAILSS